MSGEDAVVLPPSRGRRDARPAPRGRGARTRPSRRWRWGAALAVVLLVAGVALATVARPAHRVSATAPVAGSAPLVVLDASVLAGRSGPASVRATGSGPVLVATGTAADVAAWADGAATTTVARAGADGALTASTSEGEAQVPDPAGSDLWTAQAVGTGSAELALAPVAGALPSVLVAADGATPAPSAVELTWTERPVPVLSWGLLGAGALLGVLALRGLLRQPRREPVVVVLPQTRPATGPVTDPVKDPVTDPVTDPVPPPGGAVGASATEPVLLRRPRGSERRRDRRSPR